MGSFKITPYKKKLKVLDGSHLVSVGHKQFVRCDNMPAGEMNIHFEFRPKNKSSETGRTREETETLK